MFTVDVKQQYNYNYNYFFLSLYVCPFTIYINPINLVHTNDLFHWVGGAMECRNSLLTAESLKTWHLGGQM